MVYIFDIYYYIHSLSLHLCIPVIHNKISHFSVLFQIEISRRVTLEELPPVLVLHLKRFVFEKTGGCQKLVKNIDYPVDLEISKGMNHALTTV